MTDDQRTGDTGELSTVALLAETRYHLQRNPRVIATFLLAGVVVAIVDGLRRGDPVPTVGFVGLLEGKFVISFGLVPRIKPHAKTPLSALVSLHPRWLLWTVGLELLRTGAIVGAGVYGFARLLETTPSLAGVARYTGVFAGIALLAFDADVGLLLGILLLLLLFIVTIRVVALPAFLVTGDSVWTALRQSWSRTAGYEGTLAGVIIAVGFAQHALASIPIGGPIGASFGAALQVGVIARFVRQVGHIRAGMDTHLGPD